MLVFLASTTVAWGEQGSQKKISPDLREVKSEAAISVIIQYEKPELQSSQDRLVARGGTVQRKLPLVKGRLVSVAGAKIAELARDPNVRYISLDRPLTPQLNNATAAALANYAWQQGLDGTAIGVAVIDSGIHVVDDLNDTSGKTRVRYTADMFGQNGDDQYGHGTHVAGIIAGNAKYSTCGRCDVAIRGMAPNVNLINIRALDQNGQGTTAQ